MLNHHFVIALTIAVLCITAPLTHAQGYICAEGGGNEQGGDWAASVFGWMIDKAEASRGSSDVLILGVSGADSDVAQKFIELGADSATNLSFGAGVADDQSTYDAIVAADIVWMRGGDQSQYVSLWNDTRTELAMQDLYQAGGVIAGTSAGCAVLSDVIYDAANGSLTPRQALRNPQHPALTFTDDFLNLTSDTLFDTHFTERGRLGRLAVMLARANAHFGRDLLAVGVDDRTALCISPDGLAEVRGSGAATFLYVNTKSEIVLDANAAPVVTDISHTQLTEGYVFDLVAREVFSRPAHAVLVAPPPQVDPAYQSISLNGDVLADRTKGEFWTSDSGNDFALFDGALELTDGSGDLQRTIVSTQVWNSTAWDENRVGGPQWAIKENPHFLAVYLDGGVRASANVPAFLSVDEANGAESATMILDGHGMVSTAQSTYWTSDNFSVGPRQSVAIEEATLHLIRSGMRFDAVRRRVVPRADLTGDGVVDTFDLLAMLDQWGCTGDCSTDIDGSGSVDVFDLLELLSAWD